MKIGFILGISVVMFIAVSCIVVCAIRPFRYDLPIEPIKFDCATDYSNSRELCENFVKNKLTHQSGGIYTNYLQKPSAGDITKGHAVLSESQGLAMLYYANINDKKSFDVAWSFVKEKLIASNELISWRTVQSNEGWQAEESCAAVDDLRIARAVATAWDKWKENHYYDSLKKLSKPILELCVKDKLLADYYDFKLKGLANETNLSYLDLDTMRILQVVDGKWKGVYKSSQDLISKGIKQSAPLYAKSWLWKEKTYKTQDKVNMIESLMTYLYECQDGRKSSEMDEWLKVRLKNGELFSYYYNDENPVSDEHSTAVYAIVALIASNNNDVEMYNLAIENMLKWQVTDKNSEIYGAFGNKTTLESFSFDNLMALLAFSAGKVGD